MLFSLPTLCEVAEHPPPQTFPSRWLPVWGGVGPSPVGSSLPVPTLGPSPAPCSPGYALVKLEASPLFSQVLVSGWGRRGMWEVPWECRNALRWGSVPSG